MTYWKTEHFKALQKAWYRRLEDSGFQDIEEVVGEDIELKQSAAHPYLYYRTDELYRSSKASYYYIMAQQVEVTVFAREVDRIILTRYVEGMKIKCICEELKSLGMPRNRTSVRCRIRKYEIIWGLRTYTPTQLNRKTG